MSCIKNELKRDLPLISIITVTYNAEKYIEKTIKSVISQTYKNIEYIIIDGVSVDNTLKIIKKYQENISFWCSEKDNGIYNAMNKGISKSHGELLYFLNADDYLLDKDVIKKVANVYRENRELDLIYGNVIVKSESSNFQYIKGGEITFKSLSKGNMPPHQATFIKNNLIKRYGFNEKYKICADFDLFVKCFRDSYHSKYIDLNIACFREGGVSTTNTIKLLNEKKIIIKHSFGIKCYILFLFIIKVTQIRLLIKRLLIMTNLISPWRNLKKNILNRGLS